MSQSIENFQQCLEDSHCFPCEYTFKFIVPNEQLDELTALFPGLKITTRASRSGKFQSATIDARMNCSEDVIEAYQKAANIPGIISL